MRASHHFKKQNKEKHTLGMNGQTFSQHPRKQGKRHHYDHYYMWHDALDKQMLQVLIAITHTSDFVMYASVLW